nr:hypothetical protein BaRGS_003879 [Batillaria attramentaria]
MVQDVAVFLYVYIPLKAVIVAGNLLTVVAVAADRTRHTTPYVFTASLAVADLLIGLSVVYDIILLTAPELQPSMACPVNFIMCAALAESAQCTTLIALDRTLVIKYSLRYPVWMTGLRTAAVVCLTVLLSLAYSALILGLVAGWSAEACDIWTVIGTHDSLLPMVTPLCVFLLITGCLYSYVLVIAYRQRVAIAKVHSVIPLSDRQAQLRRKEELALQNLIR